MRRGLVALLSLPLLAACSSAKPVDLPAPVISTAAASSATSSPSAAASSPATIPLVQDRQIRKGLLDLATAQETVFTDTSAYLPFLGTVPQALVDDGFPDRVDDDFFVGASVPTKDTYCLIAVYRPTLAFELYHSDGTPGLAASATDVPAGCNSLVTAALAKAQKPTSANDAQRSVRSIVAAEKARQKPLSFTDPVPATLPAKVDEASFVYGAVARADSTFCVVAVLRGSLDFITFDSREDRFLPGGGPTPDDCSQLADALAGVTG